MGGMKRASYSDLLRSSFVKVAVTGCMLASNTDLVVLYARE
jgi:hypothetical protein